MTSSKVSYGFPEIARISSPGRKFADNASPNACVPHVICGLTSASSVPKTSAYNASTASLPESLYPYPVVPPRCISAI